MKNSEFGTRIRELRKITNLSQREVAEKIGINFTYLSKIESGDMNPPSQEVIRKLATVLGVEFDVLMTIAGKVPTELDPILKDKNTIAFLRSSDSRKIINEWVRKTQKDK
jgi:transcriptional regulator with XRE-family HTH domain